MLINISLFADCSSSAICKMSKRKSSEIVGSLDDILTLILIRLPIGSLIRFKSVSKQWFSLITNPNFCNLRSRKTNPAVGAYFRTTSSKIRYEYIPFFYQKPRNAPPINLDFTEDPSRSYILHSCNGLLLICSSFSTSRIFHVYNPTTNRKTAIPVSRPFPSGSTLAFDPVKSPHYKLVFVRLLVDKAYQIQIYSSETGDWRIGGEIERYRSNVNFANGVYWNGSIHWVSSRSDSRNSLRFHVETQVLEEMPSPPYESRHYFGESSDHLNYIQIGRPLLNVYEMKRDYSEWFVKYLVDLSSVIVAHPAVIGMIDWLCYFFSIMCLVHGEKEEEDEDSILVFLILGKVIKCNIADGNFEELREFNGDPLATLDGKGFQYIESLSCV